MENPATFDLNQAIQQWRQQLAASPAIRQDDVDELESHLRDSVAAMESKGLTPAEAFWIARHRLGTGDSLQSEFGKVNTSQIWLDRTLWMIVGFLGIGAVSSVTYSLSNLTILGLHQWTSSVPSFGLTRGLLYPIIMSSVVFGIWCSRNRFSSVLRYLGRWSRAHPIFAVVTVIILHVLLMAASQGTSSLMVTKLSVEQLTGVMGRQWVWLMLVPPILLWPILLGWLLVKTRRHAQPLSQP